MDFRLKNNGELYIKTGAEDPGFFADWEFVEQGEGTEYTLGRLWVYLAVDLFGCGPESAAK